MKAVNSAENLVLRLLELEQRFQSYCDLHDEEMEELRKALRQLREDVLALSRSPECAPLEGSQREEALVEEGTDGSASGL